MIRRISSFEFFPEPRTVRLARAVGVAGGEGGACSPPGAGDPRPPPRDAGAAARLCDEEPAGRGASRGAGRGHPVVLRAGGAAGGGGGGSFVTAPTAATGRHAEGPT